MKKAMFIMSKEFFYDVYDENTRQEIQENFEVLGDPLTKKNYLEYPQLLEEVEVIFSGWSAPKFDREFLELTPHLEAIFYAAGTMKRLLTKEVWEKDITVTTSNTANAIPVAEYTLSQILFSLKNGWQITRQVRNNRTYEVNTFDIPGAYKRTVGIITLSEIGQKTIELLQHHDLNIVAHHYRTPDKSQNEFDVPILSMEELFEVSDVVSLHSPLLPETEGIITGEFLSSMKQGATFINTARGALVNEEELIEVLKKRKDLTAILDVTYPEPPVSDSPLYNMDNVVVTPHIGGSAGSEVARMGQMAANEAIRYINNEPLQYEVTEEDFHRMA